MKKILLGALLASIIGTGNIQSKTELISKDNRENVLQVLWGTGAVATAALSYSYGLTNPNYKGMAAAIASALCTAKWFEKVYNRSVMYNYESTSSFILDDALVKLMNLWKQFGFRIDFVYKVN